MTNRPEHAPMPNPERPFPIGDVYEKQALDAVVLLRDIIETTPDDFIRTRLRWMRDIHYQSWAYQVEQMANVAAIDRMTTYWDQALIDSGELPAGHYFHSAFRTSMGVIRRSNLIPLDIGHFADELVEISTFNLSDIAVMVAEAERSMRSHPRVFAVLYELARLQTSLNGLDSHDTAANTLTKYGTYLPYILSSISRLELQLEKELNALPTALEQ